MVALALIAGLAPAKHLHSKRRFFEVLHGLQSHSVRRARAIPLRPVAIRREARSPGYRTPPPVPQRAPPPIQRAPPSPDDVFLPVSLLMDKEVITRTSGRRLGWVNQVYVDAARLEVVSVYLRQSATSFGATSTDHVLLTSLRQIGDVVLVHDESSLLDPPADESYGCYRIIGTEVQTEDGYSLGKVRDFIFNPDNGQLMSIRYDALGLPSIPQALLSCYLLSWEDIIAIGPTKTIVRRGSDRRAVKENDGWISEYVSSLVNALAGEEGEEGAMAGSESYRSDPAYAQWYQQHAAEYERYYGETLPKPIMYYEEQQQKSRQQQRQRREQQGPPPRRGPPRALPPPTSTPYNQAVQPEQVSRQRQPMPRGGVPEPMYSGGGGGGGNKRQQQQQRPASMTMGTADVQQRRRPPAQRQQSQPQQQQRPRPPAQRPDSPPASSSSMPPPPQQQQQRPPLPARRGPPLARPRPVSQGVDQGGRPPMTEVISSEPAAGAPLKPEIVADTENI